MEAGFNVIKEYAVFPDYRFPIKIVPFNTDIQNYYEPVYNIIETTNIMKRLFRRLRRELDNIIYKKLGLFYLAPSMIVIAQKDKL